MYDIPIVAFRIEELKRAMTYLRKIIVLRPCNYAYMGMLMQDFTSRLFVMYM